MLDISREVWAAVIGAVLGGLLTAVISYILHVKSLRHERRLAIERMDWDFLQTTLPVLSRLFARTTPDRVQSEADVTLMLDDVYTSLREGTFRGIFAGTSDVSPIAGNVHAYADLLTRYVKGEISRTDLEPHRQRAIDEVSAHWKEIFPMK